MYILYIRISWLTKKEKGREGGKSKERWVKGRRNLNENRGRKRQWFSDESKRALIFFRNSGERGQ